MIIRDLFFTERSINCRVSSLRHETTKYMVLTKGEPFIKLHLRRFILIQLQFSCNDMV